MNTLSDLKPFPNIHTTFTRSYVYLGNIAALYQIKIKTGPKVKVHIFFFNKIRN